MIAFHVHVAMQRLHHDQINLKIHACMHSIYSLEKPPKIVQIIKSLTLIFTYYYQMVHCFLVYTFKMHRLPGDASIHCIIHGISMAQ